MRRRIVIALNLLFLVGCSGSDSPTKPTPTTAQVAGVWSVTETVTSVNGGECFAAIFQSTVGSASRGTMQVSQSGASLTATFTSDSTGGSCSYQGTAGSSSIALNLVSCTASDAIGATCPNSTARRDVRLQTGGINATVNGNTATGTSAETYNVLVSGTGTAVATLTSNASFTATRR
jgi:hypothetical protein